MAIGKISGICEKCGKAFEVRRDFHNRHEADEWESWAMDHKAYSLCPECYQSEYEAGICDSNKKLGMPELTGSPKQVSWAEKIRAGAIRELRNKEEYFNLLKTNLSPEQQQEFIHENKSCWGAALSITSAKEWIDGRNEDSIRWLSRKASGVSDSASNDKQSAKNSFDDGMRFIVVDESRLNKSYSLYRKAEDAIEIAYQTWKSLSGSEKDNRSIYAANIDESCFDESGEWNGECGSDFIVDASKITSIVYTEDNGLALMNSPYPVYRSNSIRPDGWAATEGVRLSDGHDVMVYWSIPEISDEYRESMGWDTNEDPDWDERSDIEWERPSEVEVV